MAEKNFKFVLIGNSSVGKTKIIDSLLERLCVGEKYKATNGCSYNSKSFKLEGRLFNADIWDTSGLESFRPLTRQFLKGANGIFVVYDITNKSSFDNIDDWIKFFREIESKDVPIIIIGNKSDLVADRQVTEEEGEIKAKEYGADFIETSANYDGNVKVAFEMMMKRVIKVLMKENKSGENKNNLKKADKVVEDSSFMEEKKLKKSKDDINHYKNEYDKLKKDYDILKKNYDKLKDDNDKLKDELNKTKYTIFNVDDKVKKNLNEINTLKKIILQKDDEILNLKLKIKNIESFSKTTFNNDDIISVHFISSDQNINCPIKCLRKDTFAEVEEKLYQKYQILRETNNNFHLNGKVIIKFKKIIENNISDGDKIELIKFEQS